jgi:hypothetical protein
MAKRAQEPQRLATNSGATHPRPMSAAQHKNFQEIVGHVLDNSIRAGHGGHALRKAGPGNTGHAMPPSDNHLEKGSYLPQGAFAKVPQSTEPPGNRADDNQQQMDDYGKADCGDE